MGINPINFTLEFETLVLYSFRLILLFEQCIYNISVKQSMGTKLILEVTSRPVDSETLTGTVICTPLFAALIPQCYVEVNFM